MRLEKAALVRTVKALTAGCRLGTREWKHHDKQLFLPWSYLPLWWPPVVRPTDVDNMTVAELLILLCAFFSHIDDYGTNVDVSNDKVLLLKFTGSKVYRKDRVH